MPLLVAGTRDWVDGGSATGLLAFRFDDGKATPCGHVPTGPNPGWCDVHPDAKRLYVSCEEGARGLLEVYEYATQPAEPAGEEDEGCPLSLRLLTRRPAGGGACHVTAWGVDDTAAVAAVSNYVAGSVTFARVGRDAAEDARADATHRMSGTAPPASAGLADRQESPHAHHALNLGLDAAGERWVVAVSDLGADAIEFFWVARDGGASGTLARRIDRPQGSGPRRVVRAEGTPHVYCMNELAGSVTVFAVDARNPTAWKEVQTVTLLPSGAAANRAHHRGGAEIAVSPCGGYVVSGLRSTDELVVHARDPATGRLAFAARCPAGGTTPRHHAFWRDTAANTTWLFATCHTVAPELHAAQKADQIAIFRLGDGGALTQEASVACAMPPACVAVIDV